MPPKSLQRQGALILVMANLLFAAVPLAVKWSSGYGVQGPALTFYRHLFAFAAVLVLAALRVQSIEIKKPALLWWRGFFGGAAIFLWFASLDLTTAAKGTVLKYTHPLWSNLLAALFLGYTRPRGFWLLYVLAFAGLYLVVNPDFHRVNWGDLLALASGFFGGAAVLTVKEARKTENALTIFAALSLFGLLFAVIYLILAPHYLPSAGSALDLSALKKAWLPILVMSLTAVGGQLLFTQGYAYTSLSMGTMLSMMVPFLASLGGWLIFGEELTPHFVMGTALILLSCGFLGWRESSVDA